MCGASIEGFRRKMLTLAAQIEVFDGMPEDVCVGIFAADAAALKERFAPAPRRSLDAVRALVPRLADEKSAAILSEVREANDFLRRSPDGIGQFVDYALFLRRAGDAYSELALRWEQVIASDCSRLASDLLPSASGCF